MTRNVHLKYESTTSNGLKVMANVTSSDMKAKGHGQGHRVKKSV